MHVQLAFVDFLPVYNRLAADGGVCERCRLRPQAVYLACYDAQGGHLPNRFVCRECVQVAKREIGETVRIEGFRMDRGGE